MSLSKLSCLLTEAGSHHCAHWADEETEAHRGSDLPAVLQRGSGQRVWWPASHLRKPGLWALQGEGGAGTAALWGSPGPHPSSPDSGLLRPSASPHMSLLTRLPSQHVKPAEVSVIY